MSHLVELTSRASRMSLITIYHLMSKTTFTALDVQVVLVQKEWLFHFVPRTKRERWLKLRSCLVSQLRSWQIPATHITSILLKWKILRTSKFRQCRMNKTTTLIITESLKIKTLTMLQTSTLKRLWSPSRPTNYPNCWRSQ